MNELRKTGIGTRVIHFLVDTFLISLLSYGLFTWWSFYVRYWDQTFYPFYFFFYGSVFIYYFIFESIFVRTPGKWLTSSKVIKEKGGRPNIAQIFFRSLLRLTIIDAFFIAVWEKPLHDKLTKTEVVET